MTVHRLELRATLAQSAYGRKAGGIGAGIDTGIGAVIDSGGAASGSGRMPA
ncbi:MAG: hypothetical protein HY941_12445 [Gammaproteobacteria bacterium]|nr:hypothetical protein [Gammaproteobacteria bacterium]